METVNSTQPLKKGSDAETVHLYDVDGTLINDDGTFKDDVIDRMLEEGIQGIYMFSRMGAGSFKAQGTTRLELIQYLQEKGINVLGVITNNDKEYNETNPNANEAVGAFYEMYLRPAEELRIKMKNGAVEASVGLPQLKVLAEQYEEARNPDFYHEQKAISELNRDKQQEEIARRIKKLKSRRPHEGIVGQEKAEQFEYAHSVLRAKKYVFTDDAASQLNGVRQASERLCVEVECRLVPGNLAKAIADKVGKAADKFSPENKASVLTYVDQLHSYIQYLPREQQVEEWRKVFNKLNNFEMPFDVLNPQNYENIANDEGAQPGIRERARQSKPLAEAMVFSLKGRVLGVVQLPEKAFKTLNLFDGNPDPFSFRLNNGLFKIAAAHRALNGVHIEHIVDAMIAKPELAEIFFKRRFFAFLPGRRNFRKELSGSEDLLKKLINAKDPKISEQLDRFLGSARGSFGSRYLSRDERAELIEFKRSVEAQPPQQQSQQQLQTYSGKVERVENPNVASSQTFHSSVRKTVDALGQKAKGKMQNASVRLKQKKDKAVQAARKIPEKLGEARTQRTEKRVRGERTQRVQVLAEARALSIPENEIRDMFMELAGDPKGFRAASFRKVYPYTKDELSLLEKEFVRIDEAEYRGSYSSKIRRNLKEAINLPDAEQNAAAKEEPDTAESSPTSSPEISPRSSEVASPELEVEWHGEEHDMYLQLVQDLEYFNARRFNEALVKDYSVQQLHELSEKLCSNDEQEQDGRHKQNIAANIRKVVEEKNRLARQAQIIAQNLQAESAAKDAEEINKLLDELPSSGAASISQQELDEILGATEIKKKTITVVDNLPDDVYGSDEDEDDEEEDNENEIEEDQDDASDEKPLPPRHIRVIDRLGDDDECESDEDENQEGSSTEELSSQSDDEPKNVEQELQAYAEEIPASKEHVQQVLVEVNLNTEMVQGGPTWEVYWKAFDGVSENFQGVKLNNPAMELHQMACNKDNILLKITDLKGIAERVGAMEKGKENEYKARFMQEAKGKVELHPNRNAILARAAQDKARLDQSKPELDAEQAAKIGEKASSLRSLRGGAK